MGNMLPHGPPTLEGEVGTRSRDHTRSQTKGSRNGKDLSKGKGGGNGKGTSRGRAPLPASEAEVGSEWHFGGRRCWAWMHNGQDPNGWIELCEHGYLRTSLCGSGQGSWNKKRESGDIVATFGKCHHVLELCRPDFSGGRLAQTFILRKRTMRNGEPLQDKNSLQTCGRLLD